MWIILRHLQAPYVSKCGKPMGSVDSLVPCNFADIFDFILQLILLWSVHFVQPVYMHQPLYKSLHQLKQPSTCRCKYQLSARLVLRISIKIRYHGIHTSQINIKLVFLNTRKPVNYQPLFQLPSISLKNILPSIVFSASV